MSIKAITTHYAGRKFRSRVEGRWGVFFDACGLAWSYEPEGFALKAGPYLPDFWLPGWEMYLEVKGVEPNDLELAKCKELSAMTGRDVLLAVGPPEPRFQLRWFKGGDQLDGLFVIARDVWTLRGFWLVGDNDEFGHIGPNTAGNDGEGRGPMFDGALHFAYIAALSADFARVGQGKRQREIVDLSDRTAA